MNSQIAPMRESRERGCQRCLYFASRASFYFPVRGTRQVHSNLLSVRLPFPEPCSVCFKPHQEEKVGHKVAEKQVVYVLQVSAQVRCPRQPPFSGFLSLASKTEILKKRKAFQSGDFNKLRLLCISADTKDRSISAPRWRLCMFLMCSSVHTLESLFIFRLHSLFYDFPSSS